MDVAGKAKIIAISGVDGSGKTTLIASLKQKIAEQGNECRYVWLRYNHYTTKLILAFCKFTGFTKYEYFEQSRVVYHEFYRSKVISWLFIFTTYFDTFLASVFLVYIPSFLSKKTIICDRWVFDILVDLEVDTHIQLTGGGFISNQFKRLLPSKSKNYIVMRNYETVRATRDESYNDRNFKVRHGLFEKHSNDPRLIVLDNNGPIEMTVANLLSDIG